MATSYDALALAATVKNAALPEKRRMARKVTDTSRN
jgi:hypothetical protein